MKVVDQHPNCCTIQSDATLLNVKTAAVDDRLRIGIRDVDLGARVAYPVELISGKSGIYNDELRKLAMLNSTYGGHAGLSFALERNMLSKVGRLPGLPSSRLSLRIQMGREDVIDFEEPLSQLVSPVGEMRTQMTHHERLEKHFCGGELN